MYGGSLAKHYAFGVGHKGINISKIHRNLAMIIDNDHNEGDHSIRKQTILEEQLFDRSKLTDKCAVLITDGYTIEDYLHSDYSSRYIEREKGKDGVMRTKVLHISKVVLAEKVVSERETFADMIDPARLDALKRKLRALHSTICSWKLHSAPVFVGAIECPNDLDVGPGRRNSLQAI
jgi:hypothetical protein